MRNMKLLTAVVLASSVAFFSHELLACKIPVFRYALERWYPDPYEVVVVHRGPLDADASALVEHLRELTTDKETPANIDVVTVDAQEEEIADGADNPLAQQFAKMDRPLMIVRYPSQGYESWTAWSGELNQTNVDRLIHSPLRQDIVKHILRGESAVWVLIESGDKEKDDNAEQILREELARMEGELQLPDKELLEAEAEFQADTLIELRIGFNLVRLKKDDAEEEIFRSLLINSEPDLSDFNEPIAVPIFGRGRTFFALVGKGINAEMIGDTCHFVCGDCSCQVKEQNPGTDMLFAVNWDANVMGSAFPNTTLPELTGIGGLEVFDLPTATDNVETNEATSDIEPTAETDQRASVTSAKSTGDQTSTNLLAASGTVSVNDTAEASSQFGRNLFSWILGGIVVVVVILGVSSTLMRPREQV